MVLFVRREKSFSRNEIRRRRKIEETEKEKKVRK